MSQTPDQPDTPAQPKPPEPAGTPASPPPSTHRAGPAPIPPTQQWTPTAAAPPPHATAAASAAGHVPKRSVWSEAVSTTGGKVAVIVAAASLSLVALLVVALVGIGLARTFGGGLHHSARAGDTPQGQMPDRMGPGGGRGPQHMPPGQQRRAPDGLPGLGLGGQGLGLGADALHGEAVVRGDGSATRAVLFQRGEVTDITADKLTVKSTDGFSATYTIGADSRKRLQDKVSTLVKGDEVLVLATKDDATTLRILKSGRSGPTT